MSQPEEWAAPAPQRRRFGACSIVAAVIGLVVAILLGSLFFYIYGTPFDGWTRADERNVREGCEDGGLAPSFCDCIIERFKARNIAFEDVTRQSLAGASILCGANQQL